MDGESIADGVIAFMPVSLGKGGSSRIVNGKYSVQVGRGKMFVQFYANRPMNEEEQKQAMRDDPSIQDPSLLKVQYLPKQFNEQSEIFAEIESKRNDLNFELSTKR